MKRLIYTTYLCVRAIWKDLSEILPWLVAGFVMVLLTQVLSRS